MTKQNLVNTPVRSTQEQHADLASVAEDLATLKRDLHAWLHEVEALNRTVADLRAEQDQSGAQRRNLLALVANFVDALVAGGEHGLDHLAVEAYWTPLREEVEKEFGRYVPNARDIVSACGSK